jgi:hypothetical protein
MRSSLFLIGFALLVGCSSKQGASADADGGGLSGTPQGTNPNGVAYPTTHLGTGQRGLDGSGAPQKTPGSVLQNFRFLGYPDGDSSKPMQAVALSDYYDPTAKKYKVLHVIASSSWCTDCISEAGALANALKSPATDYAAQGVVYLEALIEGTAQNVGATPSDLTTWMKAHPASFAEVLDPEAQNLGALFNAAAVPFNADLDVRTMEILQAGTGYEDPGAVKVWLDWVQNNPPSYPPVQ